MVMLPTALLLALLAVCQSVLAQQCYYPNGEPASSDDAPCDPDADVSPCCGGSGTQCMSNRLCQDPNGRVIRGSCTDQDWLSPECGLYCLGEDRGGTDLESCEYVTDRDVDYCCAHAPGAENCCESGNGRFKVLPANPRIWARPDGSGYSVVGTVIDMSESTSIASSSTSSETETTTSETETGTTSETPPTETGDRSEDGGGGGDDGLSTGAKAGIGVGAGVGALLLLAVIFLGYKYHKNRKAQTAPVSPAPPHGYEAQGYAPPPMQQHYQQEYYNADAHKYQNAPPQELAAHPDDHRRAELSW